MFAGIFILVLALPGIFIGVSMFRKARRVRRWPRTTATVTQKEIVHTTMATASRLNHFEVHVRYEYRVDGKDHVGSRIRAKQEVMSWKAAQDLVARLGDKTTVYYNPQDPAEAYISTHSLLYSVTMVVVGISCSLLGALMLLGGLLAEADKTGIAS